MCRYAHRVRVHELGTRSPSELSVNTANYKGGSLGVVGIVLGVSMAPTKVRMVLVEGECADGVTVDQDNFDVADASPSTAPTQVVSAILGTREGAAEGGYQLL